MIGLIYRLIVGTFTKCRHQWEVHGTGEIATSRDSRPTLHTGTVYILRCKHCGDMKNHKVTP